MLGGEEEKIMKMAACNFLIAAPSHFMIKFIRFSLSTVGATFSTKKRHFTVETSMAL